MAANPRGPTLDGMQLPNPVLAAARLARSVSRLNLATFRATARHGRYAAGLSATAAAHTARRALKVCSALYLSDDACDGAAARARFTPRLRDAGDQDLLAALPLYTRAELPSLIARVRTLHEPPMT